MKLFREMSGLYMYYEITQYLLLSSILPKSVLTLTLPFDAV
jgi:hypothetical protein